MSILYQIEHLPLASLIPYARNARTHSAAQVAQIVASIEEFGWTNPVLIDAGSGIIAGHGRVLAAKELGMATVPCLRLGHLSDAQKRAYVIADNKLALNAGWDEAMLAMELSALQMEGFDTNLTGFDGEELQRLMNGDPLAEDDENYSRKIETPIYEITGDCPDLSALYDRSKADTLLAAIQEAPVPADIAEFLRYAAERHVVFNFRNIAEYYAHAEAPIQALMEQSALVIIDFNRAIEDGFVKLTSAVADQYSQDYPDA